MTTKTGYSSPPSPKRPRANKPPWFELPLRDVEIAPGEKAKFVAVVKSDPPPVVTWFCDETPIKSGSLFKYIKDGDRHILLATSRILPEQCVIRCKASNRNGETSSSAKLIVKNNDVMAADVTAGDITDSMMTSQIERKRDEVTKMDTLDASISILDASRKSLFSTLPSVDAGYSPSRLFPRPTDTTERLITSFNSELSAKTDATLSWAETTCVDDSLTGSMQTKSVHFREDILLREIEGSDNSDVCSDISSAVSLKNVQVQSGEDWVEEVRRMIREEIEKREESRSVREVAMVSDDTQIEKPLERHPPKFLKPICDCSIDYNETAHFVYILSSQEAVNVTWHRNGQIVKENQGNNDNIGIIDDEEAGCLLISEARPSHSGVYTCTAENEHGSSRCSAKLIVSTRPEQATKNTYTTSEQMVETQLHHYRNFKDQESQTTTVAHKSVSADTEVDSLRDLNDFETGEGASSRRNESRQHDARECNQGGRLALATLRSRDFWAEDEHSCCMRHSTSSIAIHQLL